LYPECSAEERQLSAAFYERALEGRGPGGCTAIVGIGQGTAPLAAVAQNSDDAGLYERLVGAIPSVEEVHVAVSGGIDSWLLAAVLRSRGCRVHAWYLESGIPGYCERDAVEHCARALGIGYRCIRVSASDFLRALPEFIAATETPIYNLHPVSKWLLADALRREGVDAVVTGDGADQVMRREWDCDLLPITLACFQAAQVRLIAPFLDDSVVAFCRRPWPDKRPVRELAERFHVPVGGKRPTLVPPLPLPSQPSVELPVRAVGYPVECLSYTTGLLLERLDQTAEFGQASYGQQGRVTGA
jgi:hypothetical protein